MIIPSEDQAIELGKRMTGGSDGCDFTVLRYIDSRSNLTLFAVKLAAGNIIKTM